MRTDSVKIGFIGFGNMGQAIADGFLYKEALGPSQMGACAQDYEKLKKNTQARGMHSFADSRQTVEWADVVVLAVKPWMVGAVLEPVKDMLEGKILWSVAAGVMFDDFEKMLPPGIHHISAIPSTPAAVGEGIFPCEKKHSLTGDEHAFFCSMISRIGLVAEVETAKVNIANTISGCGPAFASMFAEALGDAGVMYGLTRSQAYELAAGMLAGTGKLMLGQGRHPGQMKDDVCSPGGTTIRGVAALEKAGLRSAVIGAVQAAMGKYEE